MSPIPMRVALVAWALGVSVARADEAAAPAAPAPEAAPVVESAPAVAAPVEAAEKPAPAAPATEASTPSTTTDPWQQFADAAELGLAKNVREADALLEALQKTHPGHPAASRASKLRSLLLPALTPATPGPSAPLRDIDPSNPATWLRPERPEPLAQAEFVVAQAIHGVVLGAEFCGLLNSCSVQLTAAALIAGGGAGLGLSYLLTAGGIEAGHTLAMDSGTLWGAWHGLALNFIVQPSSSALTFGLPMGGQLLGLGAGHFLWELLKPAVGDVSLANSGGIWTAVVTGLLIGASGATLSSQQFWTTVLLASDVGLVLGAAASKYFPMSRGRTLIIDAGAIIGLVFGFAGSLLAGASGQATFGLMAAGTVLGAAGTFWFTRQWDQPPPSLIPQVSVVPTPGGATAMLGWQL